VDHILLRDLGDSAFTLDLADTPGDTATTRVARATLALRAAADAGRLPGLVEVVRALRSVTVHYDPTRTRRAPLEAAAREAIAAAPDDATGPNRLWRLPVCYDPAVAPDLEDAARHLDLSPTEIVRLHAATTVRVHMIGFLPGFPFMGDLPEALRMPRRSEPRTRVPPGSLAMAGPMTAIYPWESPGGWTLIGHCPVPLFSLDWARPALLMAADRVAFTALSLAESRALATAYAKGEADPHALLETPA
jgi:KipI family sensor histidine kinase inhibitor